MKIGFTFHAELRLKKRKITKAEVLEAIKSPDKTVKKHGKYYYQKKLERGTIEIVAETQEEPQFFCAPKIAYFLALQKRI